MLRSNPYDTFEKSSFMKGVTLLSFDKAKSNPGGREERFLLMKVPLIRGLFIKCKMNAKLFHNVIIKVERQASVFFLILDVRYF